MSIQEYPMKNGTLILIISALLIALPAAAQLKVGVAKRDITPEAVNAVLERQHPGLIQLMQMRCYEKTPKTFLSRGVAGTLKNSLVITLPGSKKGATESLEAVADILPHAIGVMRGDIGDHGPGAR